MGNPISADQHNATRRANKQRRQKNSSKKKEEGFSLQAAAKDRKHRTFQKCPRKKRENGQRLLKIVQEKGSLRLVAKDYSEWRLFLRDLNDLKAAARASKTRFTWDESQVGLFTIAIPKEVKKEEENLSQNADGVA